MALEDLIVPIIIPVVVAGIPIIGLIFERRFAHQDQRREKMGERIDELEVQLNKQAADIENIKGRFNGMGIRSR